MAISSKLKAYLDKENIHYEIAKHPLAYTASEIAGSRHIPGKKMVKSVIIKSKGAFVMCVLPAIHFVDFEKLKAVLGSNELELAEEKEITALFPDYDVGAEPPFGHLYGLKVYADLALESDKEIFFSAGTHTDVVKIDYADYKKLAKPIVADIGSHI